MEKLSKNFTLKELIKSDTAEKLQLSNKPNEEQLKNIKSLVVNLLQPLRDLLGKPIIVNSGFRSKALNIAVNGSTTSQHCANNGAAVDIECPTLGNKVLFDTIKNNFIFDQLIWEYGNDSQPDWIHVSYREDQPLRNEVLRAKKNDKGVTTYFSIS